MIEKFLKLETNCQIGEYVYSDKAILGSCSFGSVYMGKHV